MSKSAKHWVGLAIFLTWMGAPLAAPLSYSEAVSGDILGGENMGTVDVGNNTVQGSGCWILSSISPIVSSCLDSDPFRFNLPAGLAITEMRVEHSTSIQGNVFNAEATTSLGDPDPLGFDSINLLGGTASLFSSLLPLANEGTYSTGINGFSNNCAPAPCGFSFEYTWTIVVAQVNGLPEPSSVALLGIALAGLGFSRRKRASN